jgi:hypothetical protein
VRTWTAEEWLCAVRAEIAYAAWYADGVADSRPRHRWRCPFAYRRWQRVEQHAQDRSKWAYECERQAMVLVESCGYDYQFKNTGDDATDPSWVRYGRRNRPRRTWRW